MAVINVPQAGIEIGTLAQWASASATLLAVLVALFKDDILRLWRRPKLRVLVSLKPPHCHETVWTYEVQRTTHTFVSARCYYFHLWIENDGKTRAEHVQVFAAKLWRQSSGDRFVQVETFLPMNLRWSTHEQVYIPGISPGMGAHCNLGHIIDPASAAEVGEGLDAVKTGEYVFALDVEFKSNTRSHLLSPGVYLLHLRVAAANAKSRNVVVRMTLTGRWFAERDQMFTEGIGLSEATGT